MRLLSTTAEGECTLTEFFGSNTPPYAILSHTWGPDGDEVTFRDLVDRTGKQKVGYAKIEFCGRRAAIDNLQYFWVDTCCIDKSSSAELTEAINSMFHWYQKANRCYVLLSDVSVQGCDQADSLWKSAFQQSRWFSRGWTLQELLAPASVEFFSHEGERLGDKQSLEKEITERTEINVLALRGNPLPIFSVPDRMSWAAKRMTTREEDQAYCLLGIFDVYMPLIYGEGKRAFSRLNEEVNKSTKDSLGSRTVGPAYAVERSTYRSPQEPVRDRAELIEWLKSHDPYTNHVAAQRKKQKQTGLWFLQGESYSKWQRGEVSLLWISGSPGSGKTVLCSTIIENLLENAATDISAMIAYYYFDFGEADNRTLDTFIRSLIVQLSASLPEIPPDLWRLYELNKANKQKVPTENLKEVLHNILRKSTKTIVAVDGLDECAEPEELILFIEEMRSWETADLRLLVVSRQHFEGVDALEELEPTHVSIQDNIANTDISTYVQEILQKDIKFRRWPPEAKDQVEKALVTKSSGMFRWVACQTDVLKKCRTQHDIDTVLLTLPRTLEDSYDRILDSINEDYKPAVRAVLQWIAFCERPMRLQEVAEIVAFNERYEAFDTNKRLLNPLEVLTMCSSLLVTNETYYYNYEDYYGGYNYLYGKGKMITLRVPITELRLAHFTVKDYLLSQSLQQSRHSYYSLEMKTASVQIAKACLTYLNMDQFSAGYQGRKYHEALLKEWPLLDYAARFCGQHLRFVENDLDNSARDLVQKLLATHSLPDGGNFGTLVGTIWNKADRELIQTTKPLYFAASYGLVSIVRLLLTGVAAVDLEAKGGRFGSSALQVASYRGNTDCVRLLLEAGADPNSLNDLHETSLFWAEQIRATEIVDLLRSHGAVR